MGNLLTENLINYDAETIEEAKAYMAFRNFQLKKFGFEVHEEFVVDDNSIVTIYNHKTKPSYGSIYVLKQFRGQQIFIKRLQQFLIRIVTFEECGIQGYLDSIRCQYLFLQHSPAYKLIQKHYGDTTTKRTGVPLMNHIEEGGAILEYLGASDVVKDAYYLHPILQGDDAFNDNKSMEFNSIGTEAIILAMEYRRVANSYLSTMTKENFCGFSCEEVRQMLIADKVQNYKDFLLHHFTTHPRSQELYNYFHNWFDLLKIDYYKYQEVIK